MTSESEPDNDHRIHLEIPRTLFAYLLGGSFFVGAGGMASVTPFIDRAAIEQCFDNSQIAIEVAAQHGEEFVELRRQLRELKDITHTRTQAEASERAYNRRIELIEDRQDYSERKLRELEK